MINEIYACKTQCIIEFHHLPRTSGRSGWSGHIGKQCNQGDLQTNPCKSSDYFIRIDGVYNIPHAPSKINGLKTDTFYEELYEYVEKLSFASGKVIILGDFNINCLDTSGFAYKRLVDIIGTFDFLQHIDKQHITVVIYLII